MDRETSWQVITAQRLALVDLLTGLTPEQWETPSLCAGWRVRDVAAHVAMAPNPPGPSAMVRAAIAARGSFDRLNHDVAVAHAAKSDTDALVEELRTHAASRRLPAVTNYRNALFDTLIHVQDVAIPLGLCRPMPVDAACAAATRIWEMGWPFHARRRLAGHRFEATDADWSVGSGTVVSGPIEALVLHLSGRRDGRLT
ncbi:maleylpyruvate isomerase family mycothiol-dependent enzyme [Asanoa sp. NPDC049518]|uniref:maleylpyruvate isomerase family mycothiol-dependent enzyme n=1 Tax=unclassified Asanoa TaxID=2685164 RepID=UPI00342531EE